MTSYIAITDAETDPEAPLTSELAKKWRDNPIAIAEGDTSVPTSLLSSAVLLGTLTTTSGTSQSLTGLNLNPYSLVMLEVINVSCGNTSSPIQLGSAIVTGNLSNSVNNWDGVIFLNLTSGRATGITSQSVVTVQVGSGATGYSKASTTLTVSCSSPFDAGSVRVYGIK